MIDKQYIKDLADLLEEKELTEIYVKNGEQEVSLRKEVQVVASAPALAATVSNAAASSPKADAFVCTPIEKKGKPVTSPMVGTFYKSSSPDSEPFVKVGSSVSDGQVVCIIEAMKLMNEIEADVSGKVVEICVEDGQPVEFGQVLMYVE